MVREKVACVREGYLCVVKQWLPQSMTWKECVEGTYGTFEEAKARAIELNAINCEGYVIAAQSEAGKP